MDKKEKNRLWRLNNPDYWKTYEKNHPDLHKKYYKEHIEEKRLYQRNYYAMKLKKPKRQKVIKENYTGKYQKQDFKRTLAICPRCKEYMGAMRADCYAAGLKKCKALPIKYCFKCDLIMILDRDIPIVYQIHATQNEAKQVIKDKKFKFRSRTNAKNRDK